MSFHYYTATYVCFYSADKTIKSKRYALLFESFTVLKMYLLPNVSWDYWDILNDFVADVRGCNSTMYCLI